MPNIEDFQRRLGAINVHELGDKECLRRLCQLRGEFSAGSPSTLGQAFHFVDSLNGRIAEVMGLDTDTEFGIEDCSFFIESLDKGMSVETLALMFAGSAI